MTKPNNTMKVVTWLRKSHIVTFPLDRSECSFVVDGKKVVIVSATLANRERYGKREKWFYFLIEKSIPAWRECDYIYLYVPQMKGKLLYKMSLPLLRTQGKLPKQRFSISYDLTTKYPLEFVGKTVNGVGNYQISRPYILRDKNGKFTSLKNIVEEKEVFRI